MAVNDVDSPGSGSGTPEPAADQDPTFPRLTPEQQARIATFARERLLGDGESVWDQGDRNMPLFVVIEGEIAILAGTDHLVTVHRAGEFTGDVDLLSGRPTVVRARARGRTLALELASDRLRALVQTDAELSEVLLRAFILRRRALIAQKEGSVVLIGSLHSAGTLALQEFLTRNHLPYAYMDVDRDPGVQQTLDRFGVGVDDVPVFICGGKRVLKKPTIDEVGECLGLNRVNEEILRDLVVVGAGADPNTAWLRGSVALDEKGFVKTGPDLLHEELGSARWPLSRPPLLFETSLPGVFAVGDVRSNSVKRVAAAVGEGSVCVQLVQKTLAA